MQLQKHNEDDSSSISLSDSSGDDTVKETDIYCEKERSSLHLLPISDNSLETENYVTNDELEIYDVMVCHIVYCKF